MLWTGCGINPRAHVQVCVRKPNGILRNLVVKPSEVESHGDRRDEESGQAVKPQATKATSQAMAKTGQPSIRVIAKKVARMSLQDRLQICVRAGLMSAEKAQAAAQQHSKASQSKAGKCAAKKAGCKSSS